MSAKMFDLNASVVRIPPYEYVHVLDTNTNVTKVLCGPMTFTRQEHQKFMSSPTPMIQIPPRHFVRIENPVQRDSKGEPVTDTYGQFKLKFGETEVRTPSSFPDPFPLYPGESVTGKITLMQIVEVNSALRLRALRDFVNEENTEIHAGDEWLFKGPATYVPRVEVEAIKTINASVVKNGMALKIRANKATADHNRVKRKVSNGCDPSPPHYDHCIHSQLICTIILQLIFICLS